MFSDCIGDTFIDFTTNKKYTLEEWDDVRGAKVRDEERHAYSVMPKHFLDNFGIFFEDEEDDDYTKWAPEDRPVMDTGFTADGRDIESVRLKYK